MDKWYHAVTGALIYLGCLDIASISQVLSNTRELDFSSASLWGLFITMIFGMGKEFWDFLNHKKVEFLDFMATVSFPVIVIIARLLVRLFVL